MLDLSAHLQMSAKRIIFLRFQEPIPARSIRREIQLPGEVPSG